MVGPEMIPGCPPGLENLAEIGQLLVHQQIEQQEVWEHKETIKRYAIKNSLGQQVFFATEESDTCHRDSCGPGHGFVMHITDNLGQEVIRVHREFKCCAGCNWGCGPDRCPMAVTIEAPPGNPIGTVKQTHSALAPKYTVLDPSDNVVLLIEGPILCCSVLCCPTDMDFNIYSPDMQHVVSKMSRLPSGEITEYYAVTHHYSITFPIDLDVRMKACLIGALILVDARYFRNITGDD